MFVYERRTAEARTEGRRRQRGGERKKKCLCANRGRARPSKSEKRERTPLKPKRRGVASLAWFFESGGPSLVSCLSSFAISFFFEWNAFNCTHSLHIACQCRPNSHPETGVAWISCTFSCRCLAGSIVHMDVGWLLSLSAHATHDDEDQ